MRDGQLFTLHSPSLKPLKQAAHPAYLAIACGPSQEVGPVGFDAERTARIAAMRVSARPICETAGDTDALQQFLKDNECHVIEAVFVTMGLLNCDLAEAQRAFFNAPCRNAERRFRNHAMDLLEEAADTDV